MSMNPTFEDGTGRKFPFQTPTQLTYAVLAVSTKAEQLTLINEQLARWDWDADQRFNTMQVIINELEAGARFGLE